jgi:uncharacterized protein (TIGR04222 family)
MDARAQRILVELQSFPLDEPGTSFGLGAVATPFSLSMATDPSGPLSLTGPDFIILYIFAAPASALLGLATRHALSYSSDREYVIPHLLLPVEMAYLRTGPTHAVDVALVDLIGQRHLVFNGETKRIEIDPQGPPLEEAGYRHAAKVADRSAFERAILNRIGPGMTLEKLRIDAAEDAKTLLGDRLLKMGLVLEKNRVFTIFWLPIAVALVFPGIGLVRIVLGLLHDRPVSVLVYLSMVWGVVLYGYFRKSLFTRPWLTTRGAERLNALSSQHAHLFRNPSAENLPLAAALFGKDVAWVGSLMDLGSSLQRLDNSKWTRENQDGGGAIATCGGAGDGDGGGCGGGCGGCGGD